MRKGNFMTTRDFIGKCVAGQVKAGKSCSSVYFDGEHVYSYGTHYPLLVNVAGRWILNDAGYSNTTAKHINWASGFADFRLALSGGNTDKKSLLVQAVEQWGTFSEQLKNLRAGAFRKQEFLTHRIAELDKTINYLKSI